MTTQTRTAGQELTAALRRYFSVGTTTRRWRKADGYRQDLHAEMTEAVMNAARYPGYFTEKTQDALSAGFGAALSYGKHVQGYRVDGTLAMRINAMSAWQFAALLGEMTDAGVTCTGEGERFFSAMAKAA
jgi:hypothetical protein